LIDVGLEAAYWLLVAFVLGVVAVGRAARLLTHDDFPPAARFREWWVKSTGDWNTLFICPFCLAPYLAAGNLAWAVWSGLDWDHFWGAAWWITNTWAAVSYLAAILVTRDEPPD
jgi:hypothetical protein